MFYLGIDVSKKKLDCSLLFGNLQQKRKSKVVANSSSGISDLLSWLVKHGASHESTHGIMESTGVYHEFAAMTLHDKGIKVSIINPAQIRDFARGLAIRSKTDGIDSLVLARYGALLHPAPWSPPSPHIRTLRALISRREAVSQDLQRELNRLEKAQVTETPVQIQRSLEDSIHFLRNQLTALEKEIKDHINHHPDLKDDSSLLQSIPSIGPQSSNNMLCVLHCGNFHKAEQVAAYLGLVPVERQSGTSVRGRTRLSKTGPARIRGILYMAAIGATRYNPHVKALYERLLRKGKSKMSALGAAMRKLVHLCFGVLKTRIPYQRDYQKIGLT
jgi:transposase